MEEEVSAVGRKRIDIDRITDFLKFITLSEHTEHVERTWCDGLPVPTSATRSSSKSEIHWRLYALLPCRSMPASTMSETSRAFRVLYSTSSSTLSRLQPATTGRSRT